MPIPVAKLAEAEQPVAQRIMAFLAEDRTNAYSLMEIFCGVDGYDPLAGALLLAFESGVRGKGGGSRLDAYAKAIADLTRDGRVRCAKVGGIEHYAASGKS